MKKNLLNKKIPTFLGLLFLALGIAGAIFFINKGKSLSPDTKAKIKPEKIYLTNIGDNQFTVSWITKKKTSGAIKYGKTTKIKTVVPDDRDQLSGEKGEFLTHYVTIKNLEPATTYYFKIISGNSLYDNNGQLYKVTLGPAIGSGGEAKIVNGKVLDSNNLPAKGAIVYLNAADAVPASSLTDKEGRWVIYLNKIRNTSLTEYINLDPEAAVLKINAEAGSQSASAVTITKNAFPVPDIILGQGPFDFRQKNIAKKTPLQAKSTPQQKPTASTQPKASPSPLSSPVSIKEKIPSQFNAEPLAPSSYSQVTIDNPSEDGEEISTSKPEIRGTGPANSVLTIKIESSQPQTATVTVDENGEWSYVPLKELSPGNHTVYVSYVDENGDTQETTRDFVVLAAEDNNLPALTSTPSASTLTSPSPSPTTRTTIPSTESGVPQTGIIGPTFITFVAGLTLVIFGLIFIKVDNKNKILP